MPRKALFARHFDANQDGSTSTIFMPFHSMTVPSFLFQRVPFDHTFNVLGTLFENPGRSRTKHKIT
jgi:hypothetical protein